MLNSPAVDGCASLSRDGLTLLFNSNRTGNFDLYVATRASKDVGFGTPRALPAPVNSSSERVLRDLRDGQSPVLC